MECSVEASQIAGMSKPKPALGPKPRLAPKPFSLQSNTTIRSIHAPTTVPAASKKAAPPAPSLALRPTAPVPKSSSVQAPTKDQTKTATEAKASPHGDDATDSVVGKSDPAPKITQTAEKAKPAAVPKSEPVQANDKASANSVTKPEVQDEKKKDDETPTVLRKPEEPGSDGPASPNPTYKRGSVRNRLSMELTAKFEGGSIPMPPQPVRRSPTISSRNERNKVEPSPPEPSQATPELSAQRNGDDGGLSEDGVGGRSIKRRISLLFDASSRPEVALRREEPDVLNCSGGVKARIKNWSAEKSGEPEKKPQVVARARPKRWVIVPAAVCAHTDTSTPTRKLTTSYYDMNSPCQYTVIMTLSTVVNQFQLIH